MSRQSSEFADVRMRRGVQKFRAAVVRPARAAWIRGSQLAALEVREKERKQQRMRKDNERLS
jgi:hypothetical protein